MTESDMEKTLVAFEKAFREPAVKKLLKPEWRERNARPGTPHSLGFCYIAAEALYHMIGGESSGFRPVRCAYTEDGEDKDHWWLERGSERLDPTVSQFTERGKSPPYSIGKRRAFITKACSARAKELTAVVERYTGSRSEPQEKSMGIKISRDAFLQTLGRVQPGVSPRGTIEQSSCFVFSDGWVSTFNDEICCRTQSGLLDTLTGAVHAQPLLKWVEAVNEDEIEVWVDDNQFRLRAGRKKAGIRMEAEIVLPIDEVSLPDKWTPLPADFDDAVKQVKNAAGSANDEFMTQCIHIHPDYLEACDRKQATRYMTHTGVTQSFLVRADSLTHILPMELTKLGETDDWVHFRNKSLIFSCRRHLEDYPTDNITKLLAFRGTPGVLPRGAEVAAKLASVFTADDKENDKVTVNLADGKMVVKGEGALGWSSDDLDMAYKGPPVSFRISPALLVQLVKSHTDVELSSGKMRIAGERWSYLTVLGKVSEESAVPVGAGVVPDGESDDDDDGE